MRKLLLASAATVGMVGTASAQAPMPAAAAAPLPTEMLGVPSAPSTFLGGNNKLNSDGSALTPSPNTPTPGTMVIHLNGRILGYFQVQGGSASNVAGNKLAPEQFTGYFRLYPGMDAMATNGMRYGAIAEIRQNFVGQSYGNSNSPSGFPGAGAGYSSSPSGSSCGSTLYVRREAIYVGSDQLGIVRLGQDDGPFSQLEGGVTTFQFGTGAWNGDITLPTGSSTLSFPFWSGVGNEYTPAKVVYFSPRFAGFDFGISFAPNNAPNNDQSCGVAGAGCAAVSTATSSAFGGENRATNWYEMMARYQGNFSGLGVYAVGGFSGSGHVNVPGATVAGVGGTTTAYKGYNTWDAGLAMTYAGFTVGGNVLWGSFNGQVQLKPAGGTNALAWVAGAQYSIGPWNFDVSYINYQSQGSTSMVGLSQAYADMAAAGASYAIAPGMTGYLEYIYGQSYQGGVNQISGAAHTTTNNNFHTQGLLLGTRINW